MPPQRQLASRQLRGARDAVESPTGETPAGDVDGAAVEYHSGGGVAPRHAVYEPNDVDGDEDGQQRRRADDAVRRQDATRGGGGGGGGTGGLVDRRLGRRTCRVAGGGGRLRLAVVLVVPLVARQDDVARSRDRRRLVRRLGHVHVQKLGQVRQRKVFQRQVWHTTRRRGKSNQSRALCTTCQDWGYSAL